MTHVSEVEDIEKTEFNVIKLRLEEPAGRNLSFFKISKNTKTCLTKHDQVGSCMWVTVNLF